MMSHDDVEGIPVACELTDEEQVTRRRELHERLLDTVQEVRELDDGYVLRFEWSPERVRRLGELIALESACCQFMRLALEVEPGRGTVRLSLTGPPGTKELVRDFAPVEPRPGHS